jgi:hypothetical protein
VRYRIVFLLIVLIVLLPAAPYPVWSQEEIEWGALDEQTVVLGEDSTRSNPIRGTAVFIMPSVRLPLQLWRECCCAIAGSAVCAR